MCLCTMLRTRRRRGLRQPGPPALQVGSASCAVVWHARLAVLVFPIAPLPSANTHRSNILHSCIPMFGAETTASITGR